MARERIEDIHGREWTTGQRVIGPIWQPNKGQKRGGKVNKLWHEPNGDLMVGVEWDRTKGQTYHVNGKHLERE